MRDARKLRHGPETVYFLSSLVSAALVALALVVSGLVLAAGCGGGGGGLGDVGEAGNPPAARAATRAPAAPSPSPSPAAPPWSRTGTFRARDRFECAEDIERVSLASSGAEGNADSWYPRISGDGRSVVFISKASNMVPGDTNGKRDVFVRDRKTGETARAGVSSSGAEGVEGSWSPTISADGRYVAFASESAGLVPRDTNGCNDIFVHHLRTRRTERVSVSSAGEQADAYSWVRAISGDGRFVAYVSEATNLVPRDRNGCRDIFVRDRKLRRTVRVSVGPSYAESNGRSNWHDISADGRFVAFDSDASNLVQGDSNGCTDVFVRDRRTGTTTRVSVSTTGAEGDKESFGPAISADGRFVVFDSDATNLVPGDTNGHEDVFVHDLATGETTRVSVSSSGAQSDGASSSGGISADGRFVAFQSHAKNLVAGGDKGTDLVCVHDRETGRTARANVGWSGAAADGQSYFVHMSADGRFVAFSCSAKNLVSGDGNGHTDVFVARNPLASGSE